MQETAVAALPHLLRLWGKTGQGDTFHPALYHMLDVGHVAEVLLSEESAPRISAVLSGVFGSDLPGLRGWLPLLVGLHDIGKISAPFQGQDSAPRTAQERARLLAEGFEFGSTGGKRYAHGLLSALFVEQRLPMVPPGLLRETLRDAVGGHHGVFATFQELKQTRDYLKWEEPAIWAELRDQAAAVLASLLAPSWTRQVDLPAEFNCRAAALTLTGFIILSDWLGSDAECFTIVPTSLPFEEYVALSRVRARQVVSAAGFLTRRAAPRYTGFAALFPDRLPARPLQQAIDTLPISQGTGPALFIIEAPTGEGKTEAALALARRLAASGSVSDEFYFGLPTMATSNQMYSRVSSYIRRLYGAEHQVKLIHGQAFQVEDDLRLKMLNDRDQADPAGAGRPAAREWFGPKKRALLAPFGVGTVDQVELTALNARHYMLRMFGLARKTVVIDEIHAYDVYMSTVLQHALTWFASLGTSVILLSATLPAARHLDLARSFREGLAAAGISPAADLPPPPLPYPLIAAYDAAGVTVLEPAATHPARSLALRLVGDWGAQATAARLLDLARPGGAACYVANTVQEAQEVYTFVRASCQPATHVILIHSRFPLDARLAREDEIRRLFGPESLRHPDARYIVIGTQVLEQSLDVDFDVMVSDMAPIDLLLQRAGRLHRHQRQRSFAHSRPRLLVRLPETTEGRPLFYAWNTIYDEYILWRSWLTLRACGASAGCDAHISLPADYRRLIERTYSAQALPSEATSFADLIAAAHNASERQAAEYASQARLRLSPQPEPDLSIAEGLRNVFREDEDSGKPGWDIARTRLGNERVTAIPLYQLGDRFALDCEGREIVGPGLEQDRAGQLRLLQRSIPISHKRLTSAFAENAAEVPAWFRNAPLLRETVLLPLLQGAAEVAGLRLLLDPELGLVIEKGGSSL